MRLKYDQTLNSELAVEGATMLRKIVFATLLQLFLVDVLAASHVLTEKEYLSSTPQRGVIVVLSGGGAKGFAHLAVLQRLEQDHVPIKKIIGTSIGAVIGGLYSGGLTVDEIMNVIKKVDPTTIALDQVARENQENSVKEYQERYPISAEFGVKDGKFSTSRGLSDGQYFLALLQSELSSIPAKINFDELKIPFRAIATRLRDGESTVFQEGNLPYAIRASMAAPPVFTPFEIDGESYIDGGLVSNVAIEIAKQENPDDIIVASFLGSRDLSKQVTINSPLDTTQQMLAILVHQNEVRSLKKLSNSDILITPNLKDIQFTDFNRANEVFQRGKESIDEQASKLAQLKVEYGVSDEEYKERYMSRDSKNKSLFIKNVIITGNDKIFERNVRQFISQKANTKFEQRKLASDIEKFYASGAVEGINYSLKENEDKSNDLYINVIEKEYGPHFLKFGYGLYTNFETINNFFIGAGYRHPHLNEYGLELQIDARIGSERNVGIGLIQPVTRNWNIKADIGYLSRYFPIYTTSLSRQNTSLNFLLNIKQLVTDIGIRYDVSKNTQARINIFRGKFAIDFPMGIDQNDNHSSVGAMITGAKFQLTHDTLSSTTFPEKGLYINSIFENGLGNSYRKFDGISKLVFSSGRNIFSVSASAGKISENSSTSGSPTIFVLGGFQSMGAYPPGSLIGNRYAHFEGGYMRRVGQSIFGKSYIGFSLEYGNAWSATAGDSSNWYKQLYPSATIFIGADSKIGDIYFGAGKGQGNQHTIFLQFGRRTRIF